MRGLVTLAAVCTLLVVPAAAAAQGTSKDALAESLFQEAKKLLAAGKVSAACEKFKASLDVDAASGTLTALAFCHQKEGRTASAWAEYTQVANDARRAGKAEQEKYARDQITAVEKILRKVTITIAPVPGLVVTIDGVEIPSVALGTPVPVDPGARTFAATAPKHIATTQTIEIAPGPGVTPIELPALADEPAPPPPPVAPPPPEPKPEPKTDISRVMLGGGMAVLGAAAIGAGAYFQIVVARRQQDEAVFAMREAYDVPRANARHDSAVTTSGLALTAIGVGAVALAFGGYLLLTSSSSSPPPSPSRALGGYVFAGGL